MFLLSPKTMSVTITSYDKLDALQKPYISGIVCNVDN